MNSRLADMLILVSRVHEKRGDIRFMLRQDPKVQREVHAYLDDLSWLGQLPPLQPDRLRLVAGKEQLLAMLGGNLKKQRKWSPVRLLAVAFSVSLVLGLVLGTQAATHNLPAPVDQAISGLITPGGNQVPATSPLKLDLSTPAVEGLEAAAGPGFSN